MKDRIKSLKRIAVTQLSAHPKNHRTHPEKQRNALKGLLDEIGWADALIVRPVKDGYQILDGHLRSEISSGKVPCLVVDLSDEEADLLLATHDHITTLAGRDQQKLDDLLSDLTANNKNVQNLLDELKVKTDNFLLEEGKEYDESCADDLKTVTCPHCGEEFPL